MLDAGQYPTIPGRRCSPRWASTARCGSAMRPAPSSAPPTCT
jgi:hypothetical protein